MVLQEEVAAFILLFPAGVSVIEQHVKETVLGVEGRRTLLGCVWQTRTVWVRNRSHTFFDHIVDGWDEAERKRKFRIGMPTFHFLCTAFPNSVTIFL